MIKISVITPSFNQGEFLEETLLSVKYQRYPNIEHIVIDGGSTDETVEILKRYDADLSFWVSEKDNGQGNAINKGLQRATGDVVCILNSDDVLLPGALEFVNEKFSKDPSMKWMTAPSLFWGPDKEVMRAETMLVRVPKTPREWFVEQSIPHPSSFVKRELYEKYGLIDEQMKFIVDLEFWFRIFFAGERPTAFERPLSGYRLHGLSKTVSQRSLLDQDHEKLYERYFRQLSQRDQKWVEQHKTLNRTQGELWRCIDTLLSGHRAEAKAQWKTVLKSEKGAFRTRAFYTTFVRIFLLGK